MNLPLTMKYRELCDSETVLTEKLERLVTEEELKEKQRYHKQHKDRSKKRNHLRSEETNKSSMVNHFKRITKEINVSSTFNVVNEEQTISAIITADNEKMYELNVLKR